jgi:hypothetical protein
MYNFKLLSAMCAVVCITMFSLTASAQANPNHTYKKMAYSYDDTGNRISRTLEVTENKVVSEGGKSMDSTNSFDSLMLKDDPNANDLITEQEVKPHVYPNPSSEYLVIDLIYNAKQLNPKQTKITFRDGKGAICYEGEAFDIREIIDMTKLAKGKYLLTIQSEQKTYTYNIIKK